MKDNALSPTNGKFFFFTIIMEYGQFKLTWSSKGQKTGSQLTRNWNKLGRFPSQNYYMSTPMFKDFKCFNYKLLLALDQNV